MVYDIKTNVPNAVIDWVVDDNFKDLVELNPLVHKVITLPLRRLKKAKIKLIYDIWNWYKQLNSTSYDIIIDAQGLLKSALVGKCFKGKIYGFAKDSVREKLATIFYDYKISTGKNLLAITKNRILAQKVFGYNLNSEKADFGLNISADPLENIKHYVIFFCATSKNSKKYAKDRWADLAKYLITKYQLNILLPYGSVEEQNESLALKGMINSDKVIIPKKIYNYREIANLISNAEFVFGVDTGLIHLANALNKKVIAIYTDTTSDLTGMFTSAIAKNIGTKGIPPEVSQVIDLYENINK